MTSSRQDRNLIPIWFILVDEEFALQANQVLRVAVETTSYIEDMMMAVMQRVGRQSGIVDILKIMNPLEPKLKFSHSHNLRSITQQDTRSMMSSTGNPTSLNNLLAHLKAKRRNEQLVQLIPNTDLVGDHFEDKGTLVQVIAQLPLTFAQEKKRKREESSALSSRSSQIKAPLEKHLNNIVTGSPPSFVLGKHGIKLRKDVLFGRPAGQFAFPVALYDQHLAQLQYKLGMLDATIEESGALFKDANAYLDISRQFLEVAITDHSSEISRWAASKNYFETLFGTDLIEQFRIPRSAQISDANAQPTARADACVVTTFDGKDGNNKVCKVQIPRAYFEFKKEKGLGDPIAQCAKAKAESVYGFKDQPFFLSTYFPAVFLALNGHSLEISISVCLEYIVVDNILQLDLRESVQSARTIQQLARTASALVECSRALDAEYKQLAHPVKPRHPHQACFPRVTLHPSEASDAPPLPRLEFQGRLSRNNELTERLADPEPLDMRSLLVADINESKDQNRLRVVVKFAENYSQVAHEMLANHNLAPKLHHCRRVLGDMLIVIMEHLEGWKPMNQFHKGELSSSVFQDIKKALEKLGENGLVHGDLRAVNIMIDPKKQHAMIVDFDWAAIEGEGQYPLTINKAMLKDEWHPDVCGGGEMMKEHDKYALERVLKLKYQ